MRPGGFDVEQERLKDSCKPSLFYLNHVVVNSLVTIIHGTVDGY